MVVVDRVHYITNGALSLLDLSPLRDDAREKRQTEREVKKRRGLEELTKSGSFCVLTVGKSGDEIQQQRHCGSRGRRP